MGDSNTTIAAHVCDGNTFQVPSCSGAFDFSLLFEQAILSLLPSILFIILGLAEVRSLWKSHVKTISRGTLIPKLSITLVLICLNLSGCVEWVSSHVTRPTTAIPAAALALVASVQLGALVYLNHKRSIKAGGLVSLYLALTVLFDAVQVRTLLLSHHKSPALAILLALIATSKLILLLAYNLSRRTSLRAPYNLYPKEALTGPLPYSLLIWLNSLFIKGWKGIITIDDLDHIDNALSSRTLFERIKKRWSTRSQPEHAYSLPWAVFRTFQWQLLVVAVPRLCLVGFNYAQPFIVQGALTLLSAPDSHYSTNVGYGLVGATFFTYVGLALSTVHYRHRFFRVITMFRGAIVSLIYQHLLTLQEGSSEESAAITLMSTDVESIIEALEEVNEIWARLIEVGIGIWLLAQQLGVSCIIPIAIVLVCGGGQTWVSNRIAPSLQRWNEAIQTRVSFTASMLGSMKVVKMLGWSNILLDKVQALRVHELSLCKGFMRNILYLNIFAIIPEAWTPVLTFTAFAIQARVTGRAGLDTTQAFTSLAIIALLTQPAQMLLVTLPKCAAALGAFARIQAFLCLPSVSTDIEGLNRSARSSQTEVDNSTLKLISVAPGKAEADTQWKIHMNGVSLRPTPESNFILQKVNISIPSGDMACLIGPAGSGKTIIIRSLLRELEPMAGRINVDAHSIAYGAQTPWLRNATIVDNVCNLGPGLAIDERWYQQVMHACALDEDVQQLPNGDCTLIGSSGITLSGGQRQRLAIARSLYSRARVMIFDDVLSAVDSKTAEKLIDRVFGKKGLLRLIGSTTVLSTHSVRVLPEADTCIVLDKFSNCSQESVVSAIARGLIVEAPERSDQISERMTPKPESAKTTAKGVSDTDKLDFTRRLGEFAVYSYYARTIGGKLVMLFVVINMSFAFTSNFPQVWLKLWADANGGNLGLYLPVYAVLAAATTILNGGLIWVMFLRMMPRSAAALHRILLKTVLNAPLSFFTTTDSGETLNRFSQDMSLVDMPLPIGLSEVASYFASSLAQAALIAIGSAYMAITLPLILVALYVIQNVYLKTSRQLRLIDLEARAPLYSHFSETLAGLPTIRAFKWGEQSANELFKRLDTSQRPYYQLFCVQRWLELVLNLLVAGLAVCVMVLATQLRHRTDPGLLGVSLNNVLKFNLTLSKLVQAWTTFEISLGAIARVRNFESTTQSECTPSKCHEPPSTWPSAGDLEIRGLHAEYVKGKPVLKDINMTVSPGQKIGVCGRTGSGKTSLLSTVLGLVDVTAGTITIDGIDISGVDRATVRERISAVPQDTFVLPGDVRFNADPLHRSSDKAIVQALRNTGVWEAVELRGGLDADLNAVPLSQGQLQLFCLARALLRPSPIVLLDEATSNIDHETDQRIQEVLKKEFANCVVIVIAHRIKTILDADMIAVLDQGRLVEYDTPAHLLARDSMFRALKDAS